MTPGPQALGSFIPAWGGGEEGPVGVSRVSSWSGLEPPRCLSAGLPLRSLFCPVCGLPFHPGVTRCNLLFSFTQINTKRELCGTSPSFQALGTSGVDSPLGSGGYSPDLGQGGLLHLPLSLAAAFPGCGPGLPPYPVPADLSDLLSVS